MQVVKACSHRVHQLMVTDKKIANNQPFLHPSAHARMHVRAHTSRCQPRSHTGEQTVERWPCFARDLHRGAVQRDRIAEVLGAYSDNVPGTAGVRRKSASLLSVESRGVHGQWLLQE